MNKNKYSFLIPILLILSLSSESQTWPKIFGEPNRDDFAADVEQGYDKGYCLLGGYTNPNFVAKYSWLLKTDVNGNILWDKILTCNGFVKSFAIELTSNGGSLICGGILLNDYGLIYFPYIVRLNSCGEKEWCKIFADGIGELPWAVDIKEEYNGDIIVLINNYGENPEETMHLFKLNSFGEFIWKKPIVSGYNYNDAYQPLGKKLIITAEGNYLITGTVYWKHPWAPGSTIYYLRPLFAMVDSLGNEEWVLPFGLNDTITGTADDVVDVGNGTYIGVGSKWYSQGLLDPLVMQFNNNGDELDYIVVPSQQIDSTVVKGSFEKAVIIDSMLISEGLFGISDEPALYNVLSNLNIFPSNYNIIEAEKYECMSYPYSLNKTVTNKILSNSTYKEAGDWDIALSKLNLNLEYDTLDPGTYTYDSLCTTPGLPQSGFIFLDDCDIITGMEIPSPEEYYASVQTIVVTAYPNPAETEITLAFQNTEHHNNMLLECYNLFGQRVHSEKVYKGLQKTKLSLEQWQSGLYIAVVKSEGRVAGMVRFVRR